MSTERLQATGTVLGFLTMVLGLVCLITTGLAVACKAAHHSWSVTIIDLLLVAAGVAAYTTFTSEPAPSRTPEKD